MSKSSQRTAARDEKRARFERTSGQRKSKWIVLAAVFILAGAVVYAAFRGDVSSKPAATATAVESVINIPLADLKANAAKFFNFTASDGTKMRFFAIRSSDGEYRAALDACDVCYREKKGYVQDGDDMVCRK